MSAIKWILCAAVVGFCAVTVVCWESAVAPDALSGQALWQLEIHSDGSGDRLAAERRLWTSLGHLPSGVAAAAAAVAIALLVTPPGSPAADRHVQAATHEETMQS